MQANTFFLQRAVARSADWQLRYPALSLASATDLVDEPRKQIVVAAVNHDRIRMVFFSSLGSVLDLQTTWTDLSTARQWFDFTLRWNRWWLPDSASLATFARLTREPTDVRLVNRPLHGHLAHNASFCEYVDCVEARYRREASISNALFPADEVFAGALA